MIKPWAAEKNLAENKKENTYLSSTFSDLLEILWLRK